VKDAVYKVFEFAYLRDQIPTLEFFKKVRMPEFTEVEELDRTLLTDDEFDKLITCPDVPLYWRCKAAVSRGLGGCRVSDAHAIRWERISEDFRSVIVPRPKTKKSRKKAERREHEIPDGVRRLLMELHLEQGRPSEGFVFGEGRRHMGSARALRTWLWNAGVRRHEVHNDRHGVSRRTDWHSLRRSYATAVAATADKRTSMLAAGHATEAVNERYLFDRERIVIPDDALPPSLRRAE
jgi:integrase